MSKTCIYCKMQINETSVVDVCRRCGFQVWGEKMFNAIIQNMENAREAGDLYQGSVTSPTNKPAGKIKPSNKAINTITQEALRQISRENQFLDRPHPKELDAGRIFSNLK